MARQVKKDLHLIMPADNAATRGGSKKVEVTESGEMQVSLLPAMLALPTPSFSHLSCC